MRWPWQKKYIQWIPKAELLPHPRIIAQKPELADADQNPHLRMTLARGEISRVPNPILAAVVSVPWIVYPWFITELFPPEFRPGKGVEWFLAISAIWIFMAFYGGFQNQTAVPLSGGWNRKHFLPSDRNILLDYIMMGMIPMIIVQGLQALDLRRDRHTLRWTMTIIGLVTPIPSYLLHPTQDAYWTRLVILGIALLTLGPMLWPTGISARKVYMAARGYKSQTDMRRRPFRYAGKMILIAVVILVVLFLVLMLLGYFLSTVGRPLMHWLDDGRLWLAIWEAIKTTSPFVLLPGVCAVGVYYARFLLAREQQHLAKAEAIVAEVLEWKREEFFEKGSGK